MQSGTESALWKSVQSYLQQRINIIPARDKDDATGPRKMPFGKWTKYQTQLITEAEFWNITEKQPTITGVAFVLGAISGNLEIIDIDTKYKPGCEVAYFDLISSLYPELWARLRIHTTPSGGYHIIYRISDAQPTGPLRLAERPATELELINNPKQKKYCFIETKGEGGLTMAPPSEGYNIKADRPIPLLKWAERETLITIARGLNEVVEEKKYRPEPVTFTDKYEVLPGKDYDAKIDANELFEKYGYKFIKRSGNYLYYNRPGAKTKGVDFSFDTIIRRFKPWSTSTEFSIDKTYSPAQVRCILDFNDDWKALNAALVAEGYGAYNKQYEKKLVNKKIALPVNASPEAKAAAAKKAAVEAEAYPHGIFWEYKTNKSDEASEFIINRERYLYVAEMLGFRFHRKRQQLYQIQRGRFVVEKEQIDLHDAMRAYVRENPDEPDDDEKIRNALSVFDQKSGEYIAAHMSDFAEGFYQDDRNKAYKFFTNGALLVTAAGYWFYSYDEMVPGLIWADEVQQRDWIQERPTSFESSLYEQYLRNAVNLEKNRAQVMSILGYLSHRYKTTGLAYIIILTEAVQNPKHGGGSGKNLFGSLLSLTTSYKSIPGSQVQMNEKLLQAWRRERVICFSDVPKKFDYVFLKDIISNSAVVKRLYKDEEVVTAPDLPKIIVNTNFSYAVTDGGLKRRIIPLEFSDFYTRAGGVNTFHGGVDFPEGWDGPQFTSYDYFIADCLQHWLRTMKLEPGELTDAGWRKQFDQEHGGELTFEFIHEHIDAFLKKKFVDSETFEHWYGNFLKDNGVKADFAHLTATKMNAALQSYCDHHAIDFNPRCPGRNPAGQATRGRCFVKKEPELFTDPVPGFEARNEPENAPEDGNPDGLPDAPF